MKTTPVKLVLPLLIAAGLLFSGCYNASVTTGKPASGNVVENNWASGFIAGLIPPSTMETASQCPNGVSRVETKHSFLNILAQGITFSLYSPMTVTATCAAGGTAARTGADQQQAMSSTEVVVPENATSAERTAKFTRAAEQSYMTGQPVQVRFEQPAVAEK